MILTIIKKSYIINLYFINIIGTIMTSLNSVNLTPIGCYSDLMGKEYIKNSMKPKETHIFKFLKSVEKAKDVLKIKHALEQFHPLNQQAILIRAKSLASKNNDMETINILDLQLKQLEKQNSNIEKPSGFTQFDYKLEKKTDCSAKELNISDIKPLKSGVVSVLRQLEKDAVSGTLEAGGVAILVVGTVGTVGMGAVALVGLGMGAVGLGMGAVGLGMGVVGLAAGVVMTVAMPALALGYHVTNAMGIEAAGPELMIATGVGVIAGITVATRIAMPAIVGFLDRKFRPL
jgi:hypothetical protein